MIGGWTKAYRKRFANPLFAKPYCRGYAWDWLCAAACIAPTKYDVKGKIITIETGQVAVSVRELAKEWGWSKSAVDRFITRLKTETMIGTDTGTGILIITIRNYYRYQTGEDQPGQQTGQQPGQERDRSGTQNKKGKKDKKDVCSDEQTLDAPDGADPVGKKKGPSPRQELARVLGDEMAREVVLHRQKMRHPLTRLAASRLANKFERTSDPVEAALMMIDRGWRGFEPHWMDEGRGRKDRENEQRLGSIVGMAVSAARSRESEPGVDSDQGEDHSRPRIPSEFPVAGRRSSGSG